VEKVFWVAHDKASHLNIEINQVVSNLICQFGINLRFRTEGEIEDKKEKVFSGYDA